MPAAHSLCATCIQDHAGAILNFFLDSLGAFQAPLLVVGDDLKGVGNSAVGKASSSKAASASWAADPAG